MISITSLRQLDVAKRYSQNEVRPLTWGQGLLELLSLLRVEQDKGVLESSTSNLELGSDWGFGRLGFGRGRGGVVFDGSLLDSGDCWGVWEIVGASLAGFGGYTG